MAQLIIILALVGAGVHAQTISGSIVGSVTDPSGLAIWADRSP